ncbi:MAG: hypothetical protein EZS28_056217, partial [Streblomastix strix]
MHVDGHLIPLDSITSLTHGLAGTKSGEILILQRDRDGFIAQGQSAHQNSIFFLEMSFDQRVLASLSDDTDPKRVQIALWDLSYLHTTKRLVLKRRFSLVKLES